MNDPFDRLNTALEGRYRIEREIGAGGMATVYVARDLRHERKVALKILKPELAALLGGERFVHEIRVTANLQHPHILPLFDSGEADGFLFYAMPLAEGESLRDRLDRERQLPVDEAVRIATDLAEALDYAHRHDVIHRDIKPANVLIHDGQPVIADFGIALAVSAGQGRLTETGMSLGTPHYMSPEQATGDQHVGPATDIYALGCVLYEMLVGEPPYTGSTPQVILGKIVSGQLEFPSHVRVAVPPNVDCAVAKALEKLPADRFRTAREFAAALADPAFRYGSAADSAVPAGAGRAWQRLAVGATAVAAVLTAALTWALARPETPRPVSYFPSPFREGQEPVVASSMALSPDGTKLAYRGPGPREGETQLWIRRWGLLDAEPLPGTEAAASPVFSPDGLELAFEQDGVIRIAPMDGGPGRAVMEGRFPVWGPDGAIYGFVFGSTVRTLADGGEVEVLQERAPGETLNYVIQDVLRGGRLGILMVGAGGNFEIQALDLESGRLTPLTTGTEPKYASSGHLFYLSDGWLMGATFDPQTLELGSPVALIEGVTSYTLSASGDLFYSVNPRPPRSLRPVLIDRSGIPRDVEPGWTFASGSQTWTTLRLSPDGTRLALSIGPDDANELYVKELPDGPLVQLTADGVGSRRPRWSPDGRSILFNSQQGGRYALWSVPADGSKEPEPLLSIEGAVYQGEYSRDGGWLAYRARPLDGTDDIFAVPLDGDGLPAEGAAVPLVATEATEVDPALSPDGRWLAYVSDRSGRWEVYVRPFPNTEAALVQISPDGGAEPVWSPAAQELFYRTAAGNLVAARYRVAEETFEVTQRETIAEVPDRADEGGYLRSNYTPEYDVMPDGQSFVMLAIGPRQRERPSFVLVQSFLQEVRDRVGN